jgi:ectoine hydroxylase-related dioxygenase (phytanoyl-CoA dioxygenase family)
MTELLCPPAAAALDSPYSLTSEQIAQFRRDGFIRLKEVLSPEEIAHYRAIIRDEVLAFQNRSATAQLPIEQRTTYDQAFLQVMNVWTRCAKILPLVFSRRLARLATELLGSRGVRLYHDQALFKEPGGGHTPWHVDQVYWPLDNERSVTIWIPLVPISRDMGPLAFAAGSHRILAHRDLKISDESERLIDENMKLNRLPQIEEAFDLGEVSFHYGYTFHRAGANRSDRMREVMTVIYIDSDSRLRSDKQSRDDIASWCPGTQEGEPIDTHLNPLLYFKD